MGYCCRNILVKEAGGILNSIELSKKENLDIRAASSSISEKILEKLISFNCFIIFICYKSRYEKRHTSKLP